MEDRIKPQLQIDYGAQLGVAICAMTEQWIENVLIRPRDRSSAQSYDEWRDRIVHACRGALDAQQRTIEDLTKRLVAAQNIRPIVRPVDAIGNLPLR
jgi:hypothetical protein